MGDIGGGDKHDARFTLHNDAAPVDEGGEIGGEDAGRAVFTATAADPKGEASWRASGERGPA